VKSCPNCKRKNSDQEVICVYCGELLLNEAEYAATRALESTDYEEGVPRWGTARFSTRMNLILHVRGASKTFTFDAGTINESSGLVIGRRDPETGEAPAIDLADCDGVEKGVSRRHALILGRSGVLSIVDKGSPNGSYLNGQRLVANQPRILRDGDEIRLGKLVLLVSFRKG
jgi:pSer/pThr/pTyr-binding forkhead associated (FHA) protein